MSSPLRPVLRFLILLLLVACAPRPVLAAVPAQLILEPICPPYYVDDTVTLDLLLNTGEQPIQFAGVFIKYDPAKLLFQPRYVNESIFDQIILTGYPWSYEHGYIAFTGGTTTPLVGEEILLAHLDFQILTEGETTVEVSLEAPRTTELTDGAFAPLAFTAEPVTLQMAKIPPYLMGISPARQSAGVGEQITATVYNSGWIVESRSPFPAGEEVFISYDPTALEFVGGELAEVIDYFQIIPREYLLLAGSEAPRLVAEGVIRTRVILPTAPEKAAPRDDDHDHDCPEVDEPYLGVIPEVARIHFNTLRPGATDLRVLGTHPYASRFFKPAGQSNEVEASFVDSTVYIQEPAANELRLTMPQRYLQVGELVEFDMTLEPGAAGGLWFVTGFLAFSPDQLEFISGSINHQVFNDTLLNTPPSEVESGVLSFGAHAGSYITGMEPVQLGRVTFRALREGMADVQFSGEPTRATQGGGYAFVSDDGGGLVAVVVDVPLRLSGAFAEVLPNADSSLYMTTAAPTAALGSEVDFELRLNSGPGAFGNTTAPNGRIVTAYIAYEPDKLELVCGSEDILVCAPVPGKSIIGPPPTEGHFTTSLVAPHILSPGIIHLSARADQFNLGDGVLVATLRFRTVGEGFTTLTPLREPALRSAFETKSFRDIPVTTSEARLRIYGMPPVVTEMAFAEMQDGEAVFSVEFSEPVIGVSPAAFQVLGDLPYPRVVAVEGNTTTTAHFHDPLTVAPNEGTGHVLPHFVPGTIHDINFALSISSSGPARFRVSLSAGDTEVLLFDNTATDGCVVGDMVLTFDDEAELSGGALCANLGPAVTIKPATPLNALDGLDMGGFWTLSVANHGTEPITITAQTLAFTPRPTASHRVRVRPGPATGPGQIQLSIPNLFAIFDEEGTPLHGAPYTTEPTTVEAAPMPTGWLFQ